jgi:hypothetical protein
VLREDVKEWVMVLDTREGANDGEFDGAEGSSQEHAGEANAPRGALELPVSEAWAAVEAALREDEDEIQREAETRKKSEAENVRLVSLRMERLKNRKGQLSAEELKDPEKPMFSLGTGRMWEVRQEMTTEYRERDAAAEQLAYENDVAESGEDEAQQREAVREAIANAREWRNEPPLWQQICGFSTENEQALHPNRRAAGVRSLLKRVEHLVRWEIRNKEGKNARRTGGDGENCDEPRVDATRQTAQWDPLRTVCLYLGIAQRKLSALSREISGLAVTQLCDAIRAETLRKIWKKRLATWLGSEGRAGEGSLSDRAFLLFRKLKAERQKTGSHRSSFAWEIGFSSYTRMFRACLVCYGVTPQEMEVLLIKEGLGEGATCVFGQGGTVEDGKQKTDQHRGTEATEGLRERIE